MRLFVAALILLVFPFTFCPAQKKNSKTPPYQIAMTPENWEYKEGMVQFMDEDKASTMKLLPESGPVVMRNINFTNGTIEFDVQATDAKTYPFLFIYFRRESPAESESFYLRVGREDGHKRNDAVQYAPIIKGVTLWDLLDHYQSAAHVDTRGVNHVKLVISGFQMRAYVNDMSRPALEIPRFEGNTKAGSIAFEGAAVFRNLVVKPDITEGLSADAGVDLTNHDPNYLRDWLVSQPMKFDTGRDITGDDLPNEQTKWEAIHAERYGLINLTRLHGQSETRRNIWLKVTIRASTQHKNTLKLGFSDEVWVVLNRRLLYVDKNIYHQLTRKNPNGRISLENASFQLPLEAGDNELMICIANDFFGWGIVARLESLEGVEVVGF
jgi:hypothetical protein